MSGAHYRMPLNFSQDLMDAAKNGLDRIKVAVERLHDLEGTVEKKEQSASEQSTLNKMLALQEKFDMAMEDDFNTADAVSAIFEMVKVVNVEVTEASSAELVSKTKELIVCLMNVLGVEVEPKKDDLESEIEALIEERQAARKEKNFARADEIRDILLEKGIVLKDTREGVKWTRV